MENKLDAQYFYIYVDDAESRLPCDDILYRPYMYQSVLRCWKSLCIVHCAGQVGIVVVNHGSVHVPSTIR